VYSSDLAIRVCNIGKKYRLGGSVENYQTIREVLVNAVSAPIKRIRNPEQIQEFWALKDVSFDVHHGEVMGIIGRNGAGKSTLLKILSRITSPTEGRAKIFGRVGSLLEVGTGFHPELTGRENIFLSGSLLGMRKREIEEKFDEIIRFSEIEKFLDTPVKRYSSGMYVRLAFAVAAHLEPEILIIDEVLAVGDFQFQKKCLGKMGKIAKEGRTVLFVSHNMSAVSSLCTSAILLENGKVILNDSTEKVIERYLENRSEKSNKSISLRTDREGNGIIRFTDLWLSDISGKRLDSVYSGQDISINIAYTSRQNEPLRNFRIAFALRNQMNLQISDLKSDVAGYHWDTVPPQGIVSCKLPKLPLNSGIYYFNAICFVNEIITDWVRDAGEIVVEGGDFFKTGKLPGKEWGPLLFAQEWEIKGL
jgi:lipopolysaccharide transport system ATP-binding protein